MICRAGDVAKVFGGQMGLSRVAKFAKGSDGRDKFAKALAATAELAREISKAVKGDNDKITIEAKAVAGFAQTARDVTGLLNVFGGVLSKIRSAVFTVLPALFASLYKSDGEIVYLQGSPKSGKKPKAQQLLNSAKESFEKRLAVIESIAGLISAIAYTIGFGVCRVIRFAGKVTGKLGVGAKRMVNGFAPIMFINHVGALASNAAALWRRHEVASRIIKEGVGDQSDMVSFYQGYAKETVASVLDMGEKVAELVCDAAKFGAPIPSIPKAVLGVVIAGFGVTKVFTNTYEVPEAA